PKPLFPFFDPPPLPFLPGHDSQTLFCCPFHCFLFLNRITPITFTSRQAPAKPRVGIQLLREQLAHNRIPIAAHRLPLGQALLLQTEQEPLPDCLINDKSDTSRGGDGPVNETLYFICAITVPAHGSFYPDQGELIPSS